MGIRSKVGTQGEDVAGGVDDGLYRESPWHGVGPSVNSKGVVVGYKSLIEGDPRTADEIMDLANAKWTVTPKLLSELGVDYEGADQVKLLIREDRNAILGVHSEGYGLIQNLIPFQIVEQILQHAPGSRFEAHTSLFGGQVMFSVIGFDKGIEAIRHNGRTTDKITRYMGVYWSHNGAYSLGVKYMNELWVCRNTFTPQRGVTGLTIRHTRNAEAIATAAVMSIEGMVRSNEEFDAEVHRLLDIEADRQTMTKVVIPTVLGARPDDEGRSQTIYDNQFDEIIAEWGQFTDTETAFDCVMAVQGWEQHRQTVRGKPRDVRNVERLIRDDYPKTKLAYACFDPVSSN